MSQNDETLASRQLAVQLRFLILLSFVMLRLGSKYKIVDVVGEGVRTRCFTPRLVA